VFKKNYELDDEAILCYLQAMACVVLWSRVSNTVNNSHHALTLSYVSRATR